jgi:hypothetical protein
VQTAGDHEVKHEPQIAIDADGDALADSADCLHGSTLDGGKRRVGGAEEKNAGQADALEGLGEDAGFQRGDVSGYVGEFRHW